jgi:hypothetical protein
MADESHEDEAMPATEKGVEPPAPPRQAAASDAEEMAPPGRPAETLGREDDESPQR